MTLRTCGLILAVGLAACDGGTTPSMNNDMATTGTPDMTMTGPPDMAMPKLTVPAGCTPNMAGQTSNTIFTTIVQARCFGPTCHNMATTPTMKTAAEVLALKNINSSTGLPQIAANNIDRSYLLYKLTGEHLKVPGGSGSRMPDTSAGLTPLMDSDICKFIQWVSTGAN
jgi:hypothetical protein